MFIWTIYKTKQLHPPHCLKINEGLYVYQPELLNQYKKRPINSHWWVSKHRGIINLQCIYCIFDRKCKNFVTISIKWFFHIKIMQILLHVHLFSSLTWSGYSHYDVALHRVNITVGQKIEAGLNEIKKSTILVLDQWLFLYGIANIFPDFQYCVLHICTVWPKINIDHLQYSSFCSLSLLF